MDKEIVTIKIENELDVVLAYKRAKQLSGLCGIALPNQTKFATAISEICRNVLEHVGQGLIKFNVLEEKGKRYLEGVVTDRGRGIPNLQAYLSSQDIPSGAKGWGIYNSKKLVEYFNIQSDADKGTRVLLRKLIPANLPLITTATIQAWTDQVNYDSDISPYAEIKTQNMQLIELLDQLREKNIETEAQLNEIKRLNDQLLYSNTEIRDLLDEQDKTNEKLTDINRELDQFANIVSHDLKAPLYNIFSLCTIISEDIQENNLGDMASTVAMIRTQASQMEKFITDVLLYSTTGRHNISKSKVDITALVKNIVAGLIIPPQLEITVEPGLPVLFTEEIYLQQIFSNLIGNALKYNKNPAGYIKISYKEVGKLLRFEVADNGPGIPLHDQENIFRAYETGSLHRNTSTGLGLSIVDKIIQLKKTSIWVESKGSNGTTFVFTWPAGELLKKEK